MVEWWMSLGSAGQVFACIAIPATLILFLQMILTIIGFGGDEGDASAEADGESEGIELDDADDTNDSLDGGLRVFTLRGIITFFSVTGWVGAICSGSGLQLSLSVLIAVASGFVAMIGVALLMKALFKLQYDGTEDIKDALGVSGTVYMRIPPARTGKGKINAVIQGKLCEKFAVTDEETMIDRDEEITVVGITGEETLIVRRKHRV